LQSNRYNKRNNNVNIFPDDEESTDDYNNLQGRKKRIFTNRFGKPQNKEVGESFIILHNNISSLEHSPSLVKEDFICSHNPLKSLDGLNKVLGYVFTEVYIPNIKCQKYDYKGVTTYKYPADLIIKYLDEQYISLTDEEKAFEDIRKNLESVVSKMLLDGVLTKEKINDNLIKNLTKYHLDELKAKVLIIKYPAEDTTKVKHLTEEEIMRLAFEKEI
jgi:hypothetical protein